MQADVESKNPACYNMSVGVSYHNIVMEVHDV